MDAVNLGRVGLFLRGEWLPDTSYVPLDVVSHDGASYAARLPSTNVEPSVANYAYWQVMAGNSVPVDDTKWSGVDSVITNLKTLISQLTYTVQNHNGAATVAAIDALHTILSDGGTTYSITKTLSNCTLSNSATSAAENAAYSGTLTANTGYTLGTVTVTMGGTDITSTAYNSGTGAIFIASVTGNITITASATARTVSSIDATFTQGGNTIYDTTPLNDLKQYLVVTATYSDATTDTISSNNYSLSGTLTVGTSTITVSYGGKTDTFTVTVTATPATLSSISASFNPGTATIYESTSLDSLKQYLTVTATYSDSSTETIASTDYTLSGTLSVGTSTVTVTYSGKTTTFNVTVSNPSYTAETIYSNYTATGQRFSTGDISIDFAAGDYVEAVIDASSEDVVSQTNLISVAKDGSNDYLDYSTGEAVLVYKRDQSGTMKVLFRIKDTANSVAVDKWVVPSDFSNLVVKLDKNGVYLNGTAVSGVSASTLAFLTSQSKIAIGARASKLSYATYSSVKVYRLQ